MSIDGMGKLTSEQLKQMQKNIQKTPKQVEEAVNKKEKKQKLALALCALGVVGAAAIGIAMKAKKGKVADVADMAKDGADKLKKVATEVAEEAKDGAKKLSDIKFEKGIAKQGDNLFTGVIEDTLKSGKKVTLEYTDGKIQKSTIDNISKNYSYENNIKEISFVDNISNECFKISKLIHDENGKLKRILQSKTNGCFAKDFKNGKLLAEAEFDSSFIKKGILYDTKSKTPKVLKEYTANSITEIAEDGTKKTTTGYFSRKNDTSGIFRTTDTPLDEIEIKNPKEIVWEDKDGKYIKSINIVQEPGVYQFELYNNNNDISISQSKSPFDPKKIMTRFDSENNGSIIFEDDVINKTYDLADTGALKKDITELIEILKAEGIEVSDKIKTLFEKI